jgi:hypothetical protein
MTTPSDPSQDLINVLVALIDFSTDVVEVITDVVLPFTPVGLEIAGSILNLVAQGVEQFQEIACG